MHDSRNNEYVELLMTCMLLQYQDKWGLQSTCLSSIWECEAGGNEHKKVSYAVRSLFQDVDDRVTS